MTGKSACVYVGTNHHKNNAKNKQAYVDRTGDVQTAALLGSRLPLPLPWPREQAVCVLYFVNILIRVYIDYVHIYYVHVYVCMCMRCFALALTLAAGAGGVYCIFFLVGIWWGWG